MVYAKKADFKQIASEYGIDQVLARIIRNRDICGSKDIDMYFPVSRGSEGSRGGRFMTSFSGGSS